MMYYLDMHKSQESLVTEINETSKKVKVGGLYYHYKHPDQYYKVVNLAVTEWDDKICVSYQAQYGEKLIFVRPLDSWLEKVEWQDKTIDRFTLVKG